MLTLFELLNLPIDCDFQGVPVYGDENTEHCRVREGKEPELSCKTIQECLSAVMGSAPFFTTPNLTLDINTTPELYLIDVNQAFLDSTIDFTWNTPVLTIGNQTHNLSGLLGASEIYRSVGDPLQHNQGRPAYIIGNKQTLEISPIDGMRHFFDTESTSPVFNHWVIGLPLEFVTTPLGQIDIYDHNYRSSDGLTPYNPRRYVLTRYRTFANDGDGRVCGRAVRAEPQCCMQTLVLDGCALGLQGGDSCNGRCQTIRDQVNGGERANICNVFKQNISFANNIICITQPGTDPDQCIDISELNNHTIESFPGNNVSNLHYAFDLYNNNHNLQTRLNLEHIFDQRLDILGNILGISQPLGAADQTVNLSETNNHTLASYAVTPAHKNYNLGILNSNLITQNELELKYMFNQKLVYNGLNELCITQPNPATPLCVDLDNVNNHLMRLNDDCTIDLYSAVHGYLRDTVDMKPYYETWSGRAACECVMFSEPDWMSMIVEPASGRPAGWAAFLATSPSIYEMMSWLHVRLAKVLNDIGVTKVAEINAYQAPCECYSDSAISPAVPHCLECEPICCSGTGGGLIVINGSGREPLIRKLFDRKNYAKRWVEEDFTVSQPFNGTLDANGNACGATNHNVERHFVTDEISGNYGWNPTTMTSSAMTNTPALMAISGIKINRDGSYHMYMDGPIEVNHMVHAFRIALVVERAGNRIIYTDRKLGGDTHSGSGSVNNGYYKESKHHYASSHRIVELKRDDIITLQIKIDANCSRPWDNMDPITLGIPNNEASIRSAPVSGTSDNLFFNETSWVGDAGTWDISGHGVWIEYGGPTDLTYMQNLNNKQVTDTGATPLTESEQVAVWLNGFVRTDIHSSYPIAHSGGQYCQCDDHTVKAHSHAIVARMPAIAPQAPKYIHTAGGTSSDIGDVKWNYPGRFSSAAQNSLHNGHDIPYSNTGIDANGTVRFIGPSTGNDGGADYPTVPNGSCATETGYNNIAEQSGFQFGVIQLAESWIHQIELYYP